MQFKSFLILSLLISVITAPILDAFACDDCSNIIPLRDMQQRVVDGVNHSDGDSLPSGADHPAQQENGTAQDLCPVCANTAVAMVSVWCGAPSMISHTNHLAKLLAFSDPSYSINKPPQN
ncbi:MAG: hypothetical protein HGA43_10030 [Nitrospirae bacterium]|nr:hypothetical protein [Nitrospirota bacterium]